MKALKIFCIALFCLSYTTTASNAANGTSSIVIDAKSGNILYADKAEELRYPASLTKLMTLYITFNALETGKLKLTDKLKVSATASSRSPSKLGMPAGSYIDVKTLIQALIVKSANDCATVLAEGLGYSEENFAKTMTLVAKELGMKNTTFKNASGLPNRQQKTTARDMAMLAAAMYHHFPQYYDLFSLRKFSYQGKTYYTHNHILKNFEGADGMKTGFTNAAGFNIVTSAQRDGQRVIAVTMGHNTIKSRDKKVAQMMDQGLTKLALNSKMKDANLYAEIVKEENKPNDIEKQLADNSISTTDNTEEEENANPQIEQGSADTEQTIAAIEKELEATPSWDIQIGAFSNYAKARQYAQKIQNKQFKNCKDCEIKVEAAESASAIVYRAKIVGFEKNDADKACKRLKNASISCIVVKNDSETTVTMASR